MLGTGVAQAERNRKLAAGVLILLLLLLYFGPYWFLTRRPSGGNLAHDCLLNHLQRTFSTDGQISDAFTTLKDGATLKTRPFVPFVGNGLFGVTYEQHANSHSIYIKHWSTLAMKVPFEPIVEIVPKFSFSHESSNNLLLFDVVKLSNLPVATILNTAGGMVVRIAAYSINGECAFISSTVFAHRTRPNIFVQEIKMDNPSLSSLSISLKRIVPTDDLFKVIKSDGGFSAKIIRLKLPDSESYYDVGVGVNKVPQDFSFKARSQESLNIITTVIVSDSLPANMRSNEGKLAGDLLKANNEALGTSQLLVEHTNAWGKLWDHGFSISFSKAPNTLNGDSINATFYYLMCHSISLISRHGLSEDRVKEAKLLLHNSGECFNFHNTLLYPSKLWSHLSTISDVLDNVYRWKLTLDKRGCTSLVKAGVEGVVQAAMLSLGGFKFTQHHLELDVDPQELHRDYYFRGILFDAETALDVWVKVGGDNKPVLYVSVNSTAKNKKFLACDAGCLDEPLELSNHGVALPVKLTNPLTPILYVTDDQKHIQELKHSIHVKEVVEAPPHEHHVIAMHKHGHRLGGLPTIFWVALIFLLVTFHLFLFKLIYNEYFRNDKISYAPVNKMRYSMWRQS